MLLVHLFAYFTRAFISCLFLLLLVSGVGCGVYLWHSLDFSINVFPCSLLSCFSALFSIVTTSLGEERAGICVSRAFVCLFCTR